jgi:hypothetical protein
MALGVRRFARDGLRRPKLIDRKSLRPMGIFTMMRFRKEASVAERPVAAE